MKLCYDCNWSIVFQQKDTFLLERVQHRFIRLVPGLSNRYMNSDSNVRDCGPLKNGVIVLTYLKSSRCIKEPISSSVWADFRSFLQPFQRGRLTWKNIRKSQIGEVCICRFLNFIDFENLKCCLMRYQLIEDCTASLSSPLWREFSLRWII